VNYSKWDDLGDDDEVEEALERAQGIQTTANSMFGDQPQSLKDPPSVSPDVAAKAHALYMDAIEILARFEKKSGAVRQCKHACLMNAAFLAIRREDWAQAHKLATLSLDLEPADGHSFHFRGVAAAKLGRPGAALADFADGMRCAQDKGDLDLAAQIKERIGALQPDGETSDGLPLGVVDLVTTGQQNLRIKQYAAAVGPLSKARKMLEPIMPKEGMCLAVWVRCLEGLSEAYAGSGKFSESKEAGEAALDAAEPSNVIVPALLLSLGHVQAALGEDPAGRWKEAALAFKQRNQLRPAAETFLKACAAEADRKKPEAVDTGREAVALMTRIRTSLSTGADRLEAAVNEIESRMIVAKMLRKDPDGREPAWEMLEPCLVLFDESLSGPDDMVTAFGESVYAWAQEAGQIGEILKTMPALEMVLRCGRKVKSPRIQLNALMGKCLLHNREGNKEKAWETLGQMTLIAEDVLPDQKPGTLEAIANLRREIDKDQPRTKSTFPMPGAETELGGAVRRIAADELKAGPGRFQSIMSIHPGVWIAGAIVAVIISVLMPMVPLFSR